MKTKIFHEETYEIESIVNEWLSNKKLKIISINQSSYEHHYPNAYDQNNITSLTVISIFYEDE